MCVLITTPKKVVLAWYCIVHRSCKKMTMEQACAVGRPPCTPSLVTLRNYLEFQVGEMGEFIVVVAEYFLNSNQ